MTDLPVRAIRSAARRAQRTLTVAVLDPAETLLEPLVGPVVTARQRRNGVPGADDLLARYRDGAYLSVGRWNRSVWCDPPHRAIVPVADRHIPRRVTRLLRSGQFEVTFDKAFAEVVHHCATVQDRSTSGRPWLTPEIQRAYLQLHERGFAHSTEAWRDGRLVGGQLGVSINGYYSNDSTFYLESHAGKVALAHLLEHLGSRGFMTYDCQVLSGATRPFGAFTVPRAEYHRRLREALAATVTFA